MTRANGVLHPGVYPARGFSLIDLAIVMTIVGILLAGFLTTYRLYQATHAIAVTEQNFNAVQEAIGAYVSLKEQYPVPAGYGLTDGDTGYGLSASAGNIVTCGAVPGKGQVCRGADGLDAKKVLVGVVPFADLNLAPEQARDGYGRLFTYAVSEDLTAVNGNIEANYHVCVKRHVLDKSTGTYTDTNCEIPSSANNKDTGEWRNGVDYKAGNVVTLSCVTYRALSDHTSSTANQPGASPATWQVYDFNPVKPLVILSHGKDGRGAWLPSGGRYLACGGGVQAENCNYDGIFTTTVTKATTGSCSTRAISTSTASADDDDMRTEIREDINLWSQSPTEIANRYKYKVGIGVSSPKAPLDVAGAIKADRVLSDKYCDDATTCTETNAIVGAKPAMNCSDVGMLAQITGNEVKCAYPSESKTNCAADEYISGFNGYTPICSKLPAACGSAHHQVASSPPSGSSLCKSGTPSAVTGSGPWYWSCTSGGNTVNCSTIVASGSCTDECGELRNNGESWCLRAGSGLVQCSNGTVIYRGSVPACVAGLVCQ